MSGLPTRCRGRVRTREARRSEPVMTMNVHGVRRRNLLLLGGTLAGLAACGTGGPPSPTSGAPLTAGGRSPATTAPPTNTNTSPNTGTGTGTATPVPPQTGPPPSGLGPLPAEVTHGPRT